MPFGDTADCQSALRACVAHPAGRSLNTPEQQAITHGKGGVDLNQIRSLLLTLSIGAGEDGPRPPARPLGRLGTFDHGLKFPPPGGIKRKNADWTSHARILQVLTVVYIISRPAH